MNPRTTSKARFALVGGDEFGPLCVALDLKILAMCGSKLPKVAILPTAAAHERPDLATKNGIRHFSSLGADPFALDVLTHDDAQNPDTVSCLGGADLIYMTGGNPGHLLTVLSNSLLLDEMLKASRAGCVVAGSSAGAMVLGSQMLMGRPTDALNMVSKTITIPHHENRDPADTHSQLESLLKSGSTAFGIDGATGVLFEGNRCSVQGSGTVTVYRLETWENFLPGQVIQTVY